MRYFLILLTIFSVVEFIALSTYNDVSFTKLSATLYMWTPTISAVIASKGLNFIRSNLIKRTRMALIAIALAVTLPLFHIALTYLIFHWAWLDPSAVIFALSGKEVNLPELIIEGIVAGATINAVVALGEEIGWRGFMYQQLRHMGKLRSSIVIGVVWALWHWPLIFYGYNFPNSRMLGLVPFAVTLVTLTYLMLTLVDMGGVIASAILHGVINALLPLEFLALSNIIDLLRPPAGLGGAVPWLVMALLIDAVSKLSSRVSLLQREQ